MKLIFEHKGYKITSEAKYNQIFLNESNARYNIYIFKDLKLIRRAKMISQGFTLNKGCNYKDFDLLFRYSIFGWEEFKLI